MLLNPVFKKGRLIGIAFLALLFTLVPASMPAQPSEPAVAVSPAPVNTSKTLYGLASYYAQKFEGRKTANGEIFRHSMMTAACNVLPLGTYVRVTNLKNNKVIIVKTNDRLHPKTRRILDLTYTAATRLGFVKAGLTRVKIEVLGKNYKMARK